MFTKTFVRTKAASIKTSVDAVHAAFDALPAGAEKDALGAELERLHAKLNGAAQRAAEIFEDDVETFSGGTDKPSAE
jgi:hypothetical protein